MVILACEEALRSALAAGAGGGVGGGEERRRPCNYVSGICIEKVDTKY